MEIFKKIPLVMAEIGAIGKDRKNAQQGYSFRGIDDIYNAVNSALAKHGVFCVPSVEDMKREDRQAKTGGNLNYTILTMKYTFYASDGSFVEVKTVGEAMDSSDKSCNKAMSAAQKYAFLQVFCIPTEEPKDTENETHEVANTKITSAELQILQELALEVHADNKKFLSFFKITSLADLTSAQYTEAVAMLNAKKTKGTK